MELCNGNRRTETAICSAEEVSKLRVPAHEAQPKEAMLPLEKHYRKNPLNPPSGIGLPAFAIQNKTL